MFVPNKELLSSRIMWYIQIRYPFRLVPRIRCMLMLLYHIRPPFTYIRYRTIADNPLSNLHRTTKSSKQIGISPRALNHLRGTQSNNRYSKSNPNQSVQNPDIWCDFQYDHSFTIFLHFLSILYCFK